MPPRQFPQVPSLVHHHGPTFHPIDPHSLQNPSDTRTGRSRWVTNDGRRRSRSNSTPPDIRNHYPPQQPGFAPVNSGGPRGWGQDLVRGWSTGNVELEVQGQALVQVGGQPATQFMANLSPRRQRSSDAFPPAPSPGRRSMDSPVIPGLTTNGPLVPNLLRKNSYRRPRILFYHKHQPHYGFTNFSDHPVVYAGKKYPTSEHLFQSFKVGRSRQKKFTMIV